MGAMALLPFPPPELELVRGVTVGAGDGALDGRAVGDPVGVVVGLGVGAPVGAFVGAVAFDDERVALVAFQRIDEKNYVFEAKTTLSDVAKIVPLEESYLLELAGGADTLGGLVLEELGEIPQRGDAVIKEAFKLRILSLDRYRIKRVHLTLFD